MLKNDKLIITHEQRKLNRAAVLEAIKNGVDIQQVEKQFNFSMRYIRMICNDAGISVHMPSNKIIKNRSIEILSQLMDKDKTMREIASELNITYQRVQQIYTMAKQLNFPGLPIRRTGRWRGK